MAGNNQPIQSNAAAAEILSSLGRHLPASWDFGVRVKSDGGHLSVSLDITIPKAAFEGAVELLKQASDGSISNAEFVAAACRKLGLEAKQ